MIGLGKADHVLHSASMSSDNEYARSLVVCSLADILRPHFLEPIIQLASRSTRDHLVILLFSAEFENHLKWNGVQKLLTWVYVQSTVVAQDMGKVLLDVDVFLRGIVSSNGYDLPDAEFDVVYRFEGGENNAPLYGIELMVGLQTRMFQNHQNAYLESLRYSYQLHLRINKKL